MANNTPAQNKAVAALILGILSLLLVWFGYSALVSIVLSIIGIILGVNARKELPPGEAGMATAGLVCSIIALILSCIFFVACVLCVAGMGAAGAFAGIFS